MSTAERDDFKVADCPCGQGEITKHVVSWDNPWSGVDVSYSINCPRCAAEWEINSTGTTLTGRQSKRASDHAFEAWMETERQMDEYLRPLLARHVNIYAPKSKKAEHALLMQLGVYNGSYRNYLDERRRASLQEVCDPSRNLRLADEIVSQFGDRQVFQRLKRVVDEKRAARERAQARVAHRRVGESTLSS